MKCLLKKANVLNYFKGYEVGAVSKERWEHFESVSKQLESAMTALEELKLSPKAWAKEGITKLNDNGVLRR